MAVLFPFSAPTYRPFGTAPLPSPSPVVTSAIITKTALAQLQSLTTTDASKAWMRNSAINAVRAGNSAGVFSLASWIYSSGWATSDTWARQIGAICARYVLQMCALGICPVSSSDAHMLYSHF